MENSCKQESLYYIHCSNNAPSKWERLESEQFSPCLSVVSLLVSFTGRKNKRHTENTLVWKMAAACQLRGLVKPCWMAYLKTICRAHISSWGWHSPWTFCPSACCARARLAHWHRSMPQSRARQAEYELPPSGRGTAASSGVIPNLPWLVSCFRPVVWVHVFRDSQS